MSASTDASLLPRIAYLTSQYPATSHTFISREVAALRSRDVRIDTFSIRTAFPNELHDKQMRDEADKTFAVLGRPAREFVLAHSITFFTLPLRYLAILNLAVRHRPPGLKGLAISLAHFAEAILLARELKRRGIEHLHNHFANSAATVGFLAARLLRLPWSFTIHGISETDYPAGLLLGRKIESASFVACASYFGRAQAMRLVPPQHWDKIQIVRCGLPIQTLQVRPEVERSRQIVCVGRLSPEKGQAGLFEAFSRIARDAPDMQLLIIGGGPEASKLKSLVDELGLTDRVNFAGPLGEVETINEIARSQMLVLPSFMEGLPVVLMEAMAVGTPVIASRVAGIPELVDDRETGLLFTPSDWQDLEDCIRKLAGDGELRESLSVAARERVAAEFNVAKSAERLIQLYRSEGQG